MNILITGVAGLIGSRLADHILNTIENVKVIGIDNLSGGYIENINPKVIFYNLDLLSKDFSNIFKSHKIHYVYHFAAYAAEGLSPFIRKYNYDNNLKATASVVNECIKNGIERLVFTSSMAVYGYGKDGIQDENDIPDPIDPYGIAKYACEMDIKIAGKQHGLDWCIIRPHNVYGINQNFWDKYRNVLGIWMYQYLNNKPMTIYGDGLQTRAFSYIDDCLEPLVNSMFKKICSKQIINLGSTKSISIVEANNTLKSVVGGGNTVFLEKRFEVKKINPTFQKSINLLNYKENTSLKTGLINMWSWAKVQKKRKQFVWKNYEIEKGIYSYWKN